LNVFDAYGKEVKKLVGQPQQYEINLFQFSVEGFANRAVFLFDNWTANTLPG